MHTKPNECEIRKGSTVFGPQTLLDLATFAARPFMLLGLTLFDASRQHPRNGRGERSRFTSMSLSGSAGDAAHTPHRTEHASWQQLASRSQRRWAATLVFFLANACSKRAPPDEQATASRIVSLSPSTTEAVVAVGAQSALVGRSRYCDYPPTIVHLAQVGGYTDPSLEAIVALRPDWVIGARGPSGRALADNLEARRIPTFFPETESFEQVVGMIRAVGERTGHAANAEQVISAMRSDLSRVQARVAGRSKPRVLVVFGYDPISVAGPTSFADEMLRLSGGINAVREGGAYPTFSLERLLGLEIDHIIDAAMMQPEARPNLEKTPGWSTLPAVRRGHVSRLNDEAVLRPGPRITEGIKIFAQALHPTEKTP